MSKEMSVIVLGVLVALVPLSGFPESGRTALVAVFGITIAIIGFLLRGEVLARGIKKSDSRPFVESPSAPTPAHHEHEESAE